MKKKSAKNLTTRVVCASTKHEAEAGKKGLEGKLAEGLLPKSKYTLAGSFCVRQGREPRQAKMQGGTGLHASSDLTPTQTWTPRMPKKKDPEVFGKSQGLVASRLRKGTKKDQTLWGKNTKRNSPFPPARKDGGQGAWKEEKVSTANKRTRKKIEN